MTGIIASVHEAGSTAQWESWVHHGMHVSSQIVGIVGVLVLLWGIALAGVQFVRTELCRLRGEDPRAHQGSLRKLLGFYLLLGLEFLVAADIIETIIKPDLESLLVLGLIVIIRTVISFTLNWELRHEGGPDTSEGNNGE